MMHCFDINADGVFVFSYSLLLDHFHDEPAAWCQLCKCNAVEDMRHVLGWCKNETYKGIRAAWFEQLMCHTEEVNSTWPGGTGCATPNGSLEMEEAQ